MPLHPRAGQPAGPDDLVDVPRLVTAYYTEHPDPAVAAQRVAFGTSGHRGSSLRIAFNEDHIVATSQAICEYRRAHGIDGPLFLARDTHALSEPATVSALEVFAANGVRVLLDDRDGYTPTPALSDSPRRSATCWPASARRPSPPGPRRPGRSAATVASGGSAGGTE